MDHKGVSIYNNPNKIPSPPIPAKPVPLDQLFINRCGKLFKNPSIIASPKEHEIPTNKVPSKQKKK